MLLTESTTEQDRILSENHRVNIDADFLKRLFERQYGDLYTFPSPNLAPHRDRVIAKILALREQDPFDRHYIDIVLKSPHFHLRIDTNTIRLGHYQGLEHNIEFIPFEKHTGNEKLTPLNEETFTKNLAHEFWHAYLTTCHSAGYYPLLNLDFEKPSASATHYPPEQTQFNTLNKAIEKGDKHILQLTDPNKRLNKKGQQHLNRLKEASKKYIQKRYPVIMPSHSNIAKKVKFAITQGGKVREPIFEKLFDIYIDSITSESGGGSLLFETVGNR